MTKKKHLKKSKNPSNKISETVTLTWIQATISEEFSPISQVYGVCFNNKGEILIGRQPKNTEWQITGGSPEKGESLEETLCREVLEEVDVKIKNIELLGFQRVDHKNNPFGYVGDVYFQARCYCEVDKILEQTPDPVNGVIWERRFVSQKKILKYVPWGVTGEAMFRDAIALFQTRREK